jgi:hypothetical protein
VSDVKTYWNGEPCKATKVVVVVGKAPRPTWWCARFEGEKRAAVKVEYEGEVFYLDNEGGTGWLKVTEGKGGPHCGHKSLPRDSVEVQA